MEKELLKELSKNLNWYEKIIVKVFKKIAYKIYRYGMIKEFNLRNKLTSKKYD